VFALTFGAWIYLLAPATPTREAARPPLLRPALAPGRPPELVIDSSPPREGATLLFFQGRPTVPAGDEWRAVVTEEGTLLVSDAHLRLRPLVLGLGGGVLSATADSAGWWVSTRDGAIVRTDADGRARARMRATFAASALWPDPAGGGVLAARSPEHLAFLPESSGSPLVVRLDRAGQIRERRGIARVPQHSLLTTLANAGYAVSMGDTVYFAPLSRPEVVALGPGGDTLWTSAAVDAVSAPEPRFAVEAGRARIVYQPVNLALTIGPDHLYVLRAADTVVRRVRLDVIDRRSGAVAASAALPGPRATLAVGRLGRVYGLDEARLLGAVPPGAREPLPPFDLPVMGGGHAVLPDFAGKVLLLNLWASWCTPCRTEMPALDTLQRALAGDGFAFLALSEDASRRDAERFVAEFGFRFPVLYGEGRLQELYAYPGLPYTLLVDREGRVIRRWIGELGPRDFALIRMLVRSEHLLRGDAASSSAAPHDHRSVVHHSP
jgi:thiol-disulfide isomerase/thioredoxin